MAPASLSDRVRAAAFAPKIIAMTERFAGGAPLDFADASFAQLLAWSFAQKAEQNPSVIPGAGAMSVEPSRRDLISRLIKQVEQVFRTRVFLNNEDWFAELRCRNTRGGVIDHQLDRVAAAPYVAAQMTGDMDRDTAGLGEKMAERRLGGAKGNPRQSRAVERIG